MKPDYVHLMKVNHPDKLQTNCYGLARWRYRRHVETAFRGWKILEKQVPKLEDGKFFVYWQCITRKYL